MTSNDLVLVTGGTGFVGAHCLLALLNSNYRVRTTLRSLKRRDEVLDMLRAGGATEDQTRSVEFAVADLMKDDGWVEACKGCTYVLHVASPFPANVPKDPNELIVPARDGALRALRAARDSGTVKRVVLTSSFAAIGYGHPPTKGVFTEEDWSDLKNPNATVPPYPQSKTLAERAAWDWIAKEGGDLELAVVNPVGIFGPLLGKDYAFSIELIVRLINGQIPGLPKVEFGVVDVRDVAEVHIKAMTDPKAAGQRFLAVSDDPFLSIQSIAESLKRQLGDKAKKVTTREVPNFLVKFLGMFDASVNVIVPELSKHKTATNKKAKDTLGWQPRSADEAVKSSAESLFRFGLAK